MPESAAQFALRSADALAATLNMRRTMARLVDLAVPRFGDWAAVSLVQDAHLRQIGGAGVAGGVIERTVRLRILDEGAGKILAAATGGTLGAVSASVATLQALGAPDDVAAELAAAGALVTAVPLSTQAAESAALVVVGTREPHHPELSALSHRGALAISSAFIYEEHAALASTLRTALLPAPLPHIPGIDLGASYRPAEETTSIGGDFYDVTPLPDGRWTVSIGDVCGKGVDAAVLTGQVRQALRTGSLVGDDPVATLRLLNDSMLAVDGDQYVTLVYGLMRRVGGALHLCLAAGGHPPPLLLRHGEVSTVPVRGTIVGMLPDVSFAAVDVELGPGDLLLLYTDGANEARGAAGMLGVEPLERLLADCDDLPARAVTERLMQLVLEHLGGRSHDDIALLAVRCEP